MGLRKKMHFSIEKMWKMIQKSENVVFFFLDVVNITYNRLLGVFCTVESIFGVAKSQKPLFGVKISFLNSNLAILRCLRLREMLFSELKKSIFPNLLNLSQRPVSKGIFHHRIHFLGPSNPKMMFWSQKKAF